MRELRRCLRRALPRPLAEKNGNYSIECVSTNGTPLTTLNGSTTNGEFNVVWNLVDGHGQRLHGEPFNAVVHITLPDSSRTQTLRWRSEPVQ